MVKPRFKNGRLGRFNAFKDTAPLLAAGQFILFFTLHPEGCRDYQIKQESNWTSDNR
jgi:hypothetical protein